MAAARFELRVLALAGGLILGAAGLAPASTYHVAPDGDDLANGLTPGTAWATINRSLQAAQPGDSVLVANGNYIEAVQTVRSGTPGNPIVLLAAGDSVRISNADDLDDEAFVKTPGFNNLYQLSGWHQGDLRQTYFSDIEVDDPNVSYFVLHDEDGPIPITPQGITTLAVLDTIPGAYVIIGDTLFVHTLGSVQPGSATTDLWSCRPVNSLRIVSSHIVVDGFRFYYGSSSAGGLVLAGGSSFCEIKNCYLATSTFIAGGRNNTIRNIRSTNTIFRGNSHQWYSNGSGSGLTLSGSNITVVGGEIWHNWNNVSSDGDSLLVDGLIIHGAPNHGWLPEAAKGLTIRNVLMYNCQDGLYLSSCEDVLIENVTSFDGVFYQWRSGSGLDIGPVVVRNCILMGGMSYGNPASGIPPDIESRVTYERNIFLKTPSWYTSFLHYADYVRRDLDDYIAHSLAFPAEPHATMIDNIELDSGFGTVIRGGAWLPETDAWDAHVTDRSSPAYNAGSPLTGSTRDFEGDPRPGGGAFDIGADEFAEAVSCDPTGFQAMPSGTRDRGIDLSWNASPCDSIVGYLLYRSTSPVLPDTAGNFRASLGLVTAFPDTTPTYGTYHYVLFAVDGLGNISGPSNAASAVSPDHAPPTAPSSLGGSSGYAHVNLIWARNPDPDLRRYRIHADTTASPTAIVDSTASGSDTTRVISGLVNGLAYHFRVSAVDSSGNQGPYSNEVVLTPGGIEPGAPLPATGLTATPSPSVDRGIQLAWTSSASGDVIHYLLYRSTATITDTTGLGIAATGPIPAYADVAPAYDTYHYVVFAQDDSGYISVASNEAVAASPDRLAPAPPFSLSGTPASGQVSLTWSGSAAADLMRYRVYAGTAPGPSSVADSTVSGDTTAVVTGLVNGTAYYFRVAAVDSSLNMSGFSNEITITPRGPAPSTKTALLQNPGLSNHLEVVVVSDRELLSAPVVRIGLSPDTTGVSLTMTAIDGSPTEFHGAHVLNAVGNYSVRTQATAPDGAASDETRAFAATTAEPGRPATLTAPDGGARLQIPVGAVPGKTYFLAQSSDESGQATYRFGPVGGGFQVPLVVEIEYDAGAVEDPGKLFVQYRQGDAWISLPTLVYPASVVARATVERLGEFRLAADSSFPGDNTAPLVFAVRPNYPNPFRPSTVIAYDLPETSPVRVAVFDASGRRVVTLLDAEQPAGHHWIEWRGRDETGTEVASGVYFCRVDALGSRRTLKLTRVR